MCDAFGEVSCVGEVSEGVADGRLAAANHMSNFGLRFAVVMQFEDEGMISRGEAGEIAYRLRGGLRHQWFVSPDMEPAAVVRSAALERGRWRGVLS